MIDTVITQTRYVRDQDRYTITAGRYVWRGPASDPVFCFQNCRDVVVDRVDVVCENLCEAVFVSERTKTGPGTIPPTLHQYRNVRVYGNGLATAGFVARGIDENNEHHRFDCVSLYGCLTGWSFRGQQSKEHLLTQCRFESGVTALSSDTGFQWIGGTAAVCTTGILLTRVGDPIRVQGVGFEACGRVLITAGPATDAQPIVLDSVRYAADQLAQGGQYPDACIVLQHAGPLTLIGGSYGDGAQRVPLIHLAGIGEQAVNLIGAKFGAFEANAVDVIRSNPGVRATIHTGAVAFQNAATSRERTTVRAGV